MNLQSEQNAIKKTLCDAVGKLHDTVRALCPNKSLPAIENVCRSPKKTLNPKISVQVPSRPMSVPTAAALKMGVGFPLNNLPGTSDDTNRILSTQCQQQPTELLNECGICKQVSDQHCLAKCDTCKLYYHLGCLSPPLTRHPKKSKIYGWQCSECDEDNPDGVVPLASGPRKSRTKYSKDGLIVPVDTILYTSNGNDTAESAPNSLSPSSIQSDTKRTITIEMDKSPEYSTNSPNASCTNFSTAGLPLNNEKKSAKRRVKKNNVKALASENAVAQPKEENESVGGCSATTNSVETGKNSPSKVKRRKKTKVKEQSTTTTNTTQSDSSYINANDAADLKTIQPANEEETESKEIKSNEVETKRMGYGSSSHKLNRKRRKEKHRSKERSERSSSKERKKKRKRKNHDEDKLPTTFSLADGVPKIKIKVN